MIPVFAGEKRGQLRRPGEAWKPHLFMFLSVRVVDRRPACRRNAVLKKTAGNIIRRSFIFVKESFTDDDDWSGR
jgi:hypothetical protein